MGFRVDLHVHSTASPCSLLTGVDIAAEAVAAGLHGIAVVDHDALPAVHTIERISETGLKVFRGVEITTDDGDLLLFGVDRLPPDGLRSGEVIAWTRAQSGAAVAAHPCRVTRPASGRLANDLDLPVEILNGRCTVEENSAASIWARGHAMVGGSDAHLPGEIGVFATEFPHLPRSTTDFCALLRAGECRPSPGLPGLHAAFAAVAHP